MVKPRASYKSSCFIPTTTDRQKTATHIQVIIVDELNAAAQRCSWELASTVGFIKQRGSLAVKRGGNSQQTHYGQVVFTSLDTTHVRPINPSVNSQHLLR
jgi:hypothetical protein